jgi:hypothetical protein
MACHRRDYGVSGADVSRGGPVRTKSASGVFKVDAERRVGHVFQHDQRSCGLTGYSEARLHIVRLDSSTIVQSPNTSVAIIHLFIYLHRNYRQMFIYRMFPKLLHIS